MTKHEFNLLNPNFHPNQSNTLHINEISNHPRTILYGRNENAQTYHVFIKDNSFITNACIDKWAFQSITSDFIFISHLLRMTFIPSLCDFETCMLLSRKNINLTFSNYND